MYKRQAMDGMGKSIPMARAPHDQMRFGFSSFAQVRKQLMHKYKYSTLVSGTKLLGIRIG